MSISIREKMGAAFPDKDILIGETGWPSQGRMREGALPSLVNQVADPPGDSGAGQAARLPGQRHRGLRPALEAAAGRHRRRLLGAVRLTRRGSRSSSGGAGLQPSALAVARRASALPSWPLIFAAGGVDAAAGWCVPRHRRGRGWRLPSMALCGRCGCWGSRSKRPVYESLGLGAWLRSGALVALAAFVPIAAAQHASCAGTIVPSFADSSARGDAAKSARPDIADGAC